MTGPSPVDRGKPGSKIHVLSEGAGLPPRCRCLGREHQRLLRAQAPGEGDPRDPIPPRTTPTQADKLHADKAYDHAELRQWVRRRGIRVRIARKSIETSEKLGRHRWVIERTISWLTGYRRLTIHYEHKANHFLAFLTRAAAITCFKRLQQLAT